MSLKLCETVDKIITKANNIFSFNEGNVNNDYHKVNSGMLKVKNYKTGFYV